MIKTIDVTTTHNVIIRYELGSIRDRILASFIDLVIVVITASILIGILGQIIGWEVAATIIIIIVGTYHLLMENFNYGQSLGKRIMNLTVINLKGQNPNIYESFLRWIFRLVDISMSFGIVGALCALSSNKNQRIGDHFAHTTVIKDKEGSHLSLDKIKQIDKREREILYPGIGSFEEEDILLIKDVINRYAANASDENQNLLHHTARVMAHKLKVSMADKQPKKFLSELIIDYVYITR